MPDTQIKVDTGLLREYANRLKKANSRLNALEGDLEALYRREGLLDIGAILRSGNIRWNKTIDGAAQYLLDTADDFDRVEREIGELLDRSMEGENPFAYFDDGQQMLTVAGSGSHLTAGEYAFAGDNDHMTSYDDAIVIGDGVSLCVNSDDIVINNISLRAIASCFGLGFVDYFKGQWSQIETLLSPENYSVQEWLQNYIPGYTIYKGLKGIVDTAIDTYSSFIELFTSKDPYDFAYQYGRICGQGVENIVLLAATEGAGKVITSAGKGGVLGSRAAGGAIKESSIKPWREKISEVANGHGKSISGLSESFGIVQSRINIANGPTRFSPSNRAGLEHVIDRHFNPGKNAGQFTITIDE